jgi:NAD(P)-dependent dehydrogenase (short-subunit alcohol dehydrogenase family)
MSSSGRTGGDGPVALVTGAGGGIGGAVVTAFSEAGFTVFGLDREDADLTDAAQVGAAVERFERLDAVVCAHGGSGRRFGDGPVDECTDEGWDATLDMNLRSVFLICRAALPALRAAGGGAIVTVASVLGLVGDRDFATHAYAASKGGLIALTRAMAVTYATEGIRCNVVCPGLIETPMSERAQADPAIRARLGELQPLTGDLGRPEDVAEAVLYLATAPFATGTVLTVDGGWTAR